MRRFLSTILTFLCLVSFVYAGGPIFVPGNSQNAVRGKAIRFDDYGIPARVKDKVAVLLDAPCLIYIDKEIS